MHAHFCWAKSSVKLLTCSQARRAVLHPDLGSGRTYLFTGVCRASDELSRKPRGELRKAFLLCFSTNGLGPLTLRTHLPLPVLHLHINKELIIREQVLHENNNMRHFSGLFHKIYILINTFTYIKIFF